MKIYEYMFNNNNLPSKFNAINSNYLSTYDISTPIRNYLYNEMLDFNKTLIYSLHNNEGDLVSYAYLFKVLEDKSRDVELPSQSYIIREVETLEKYRRKGYCKKLMNWVYNRHKDKFIFLEVNKTNIYALKCYSFLKPYTNNKLEYYYNKYLNEIDKWFHLLPNISQKQILNSNPHLLSKLVLYSN